MLPRQSLLLVLSVWCAIGCWVWPVSRATRAQWTKRRYRSTQQQATGAAQRDPLLYNMFEVLIGSLDEKFRRVDTIERAVHMVMRHMEIMDERIQKSNNVSEAVLNRLERLERRLTMCLESQTDSPLTARSGQVRSGMANSDSLQRHLMAVDSHVTRLQRTLDGLEVSMVAASSDRGQYATPVKGAGWPNIPTTTTTSAQQPRPNQSPTQCSCQTTSQRQSAENMTSSVERLNGRLESIEGRLGRHMGAVDTSLSRISTAITTVSSALIPQQPSTGRSQARPLFDVLIDKINPLTEVSSKMDEVWNVVVGTKSSVDDLVPKSEQLLHTSNRQERAINSIQNDLQTTTRKIIANIGMMEQKLRQVEDERSAVALRLEAEDDYIGPRDQLRAEGSAIFGRTAAASKRFIRPATLPGRLGIPSPTPISNSDQEAPFDLLDKEFLEAYNNFTATSTTTQSPVLSLENRGRPKGIVFPGRKIPTESTFTFLDTDSLNNVGAYSCSDFRENGMNKSGVYYLRIDGTTYWYLKVFCDMQTDGGGWTVIQRRSNYDLDRQQNFNQPWESYKQGFGEPTRDFWLGNENIFMLTNMERYELRVEVEDFEGQTRYAKYSNFKIHGETDNYKLEIDGYSGTAGDSMNDPWYGNNFSPFSTFDRDNDRSSLNCANMLKGGWWWRSCGRGLNGLYLEDPNDAIARQGIVWHRWRGWDYSLRKSVMMIRPHKLKQQLVFDSNTEKHT